MKRGITLKLGYADTAIYQCPKCAPPQKYYTKAIAPDLRCKYCGSKLEFIRKISFVDVPGHELLMTIMLAGATLMDGVIFVIDATQDCPQPQTREHFMALTIIGVRKIIIVQNKIDVAGREQALKNYKQIKDFIKGTWAENAPIIPMSALHKVNLDVLIQAMQEVFPTPKRDPNLSPLMYVARSFDVNKPGTTPEKLKGGVIGGTIIQGKFKVGDEIEIRPGLRIIEKGRVKFRPLFTEIISLKSGDEFLDEAYPGGLIGVGTRLDPSITKADGLMGNVVGLPGKLPPVRMDLKLEVHLLKRVVGTRDLRRVEPIRKNETLALNIGTAATLGIVSSIKSNETHIRLKFPICVDIGNRVAISRRVLGHWRLIGYGTVIG